MIYGYLRVSTNHQVVDNQLNEIKQFAKEKKINIDKWVVETVSGTKHENERELGRLLKKLKSGDKLIITEISRLSRSLTSVMTIMGKLLEKEVTLYSTKDKYTFDNSINSKVLCFAFGLVAEIERNLISARTKEALLLRKQQGVKLGRPVGSMVKTKILIDNSQSVRQLLEDGLSRKIICKKYGVSKSTLQRFRENYLKSEPINS